jgi:hypothetical protein
LYSSVININVIATYGNLGLNGLPVYCGAGEIKIIAHSVVPVLFRK